jgi:hypothetical protein
MVTEQRHVSLDNLHATKTSVYTTQGTIHLSVDTSDVLKLFSCHLHGTDGASIAWFFHAAWKVIELFGSFCYSNSYYLLLSSRAYYTDMYGYFHCPICPVFISGRHHTPDGMSLTFTYSSEGVEWLCRNSGKVMRAGSTLDSPSVCDVHRYSIVGLMRKNDRIRLSVTPAQWHIVVYGGST